MSEAACVTCDLFAHYEQGTSNFIGSFANAIYQPALSVFVGISSVWIVVTGWQVILGRSDLDAVLRQFIGVVLGYAATLATPSDLTTDIYHAVTNFAMGAASAFLSFDGASPDPNGMMAIAETIEVVALKPIRMIGVAIENAGMLDTLFLALLGIGLMIPNLLMMVTFISQVAMTLFRCSMLVVLAPFICLFAGFPFGRNQIWTVIRTMVGSFVTLASVSAAYGLVIYAIESMMRLTGAGQGLSEASAMELYVGPLVMAFVGVFMINEAIQFAGTFTGAILGNTGGGALASRLNTTAGAAAKGAGRLGWNNLGGRRAATAAGVALKAGAGKAGETFKRYFGGGSGDPGSSGPSQHPADFKKSSGRITKPV